VLEWRVPALASGAKPERASLAPSLAVVSFLSAAAGCPGYRYSDSVRFWSVGRATRALEPLDETERRQKYARSADTQPRSLSSV